MRKYISIIALSIFALTACATADMEAEPSFYVSLECNPTTGYIWDYTTEGPGEIEASYSAIESTSDLIGSPAVFSYSFRGVKEGNVTLIFEYARPWEGGEKLYTEVYKLLVNPDLTITEL